MGARDPSRARPRPDAIDVWPIVLTGDATSSLRLLSAAERTRHARRSGEQARRFALAHGSMRRIIGRYLGAHPSEVPLSTRPGQPPRTPGLHLSLSHSEDAALLAVSQSPVGVDIETVAPLAEDELAELAELTLSPAELATLRSTAAPERSRAWLRCWTRREAVVKAKPGALQEMAISDLDVSGGRVLELTVSDLPVGAAHVAALACAIGDPEIRWRRLTDE